MFERFTERARKVVVLAQEEASRLRHGYIGTEHLLLGLLREKEGIAAQTLDRFGLTVPGTRQRVEAIVGPSDDEPGAQAPFTPRTKKVLELSLREALQLGHNYIGTEHLLLGLLRESEGVAALVLEDHGTDPDEVRREVVRRLGGGRSGRGGRVATVGGEAIGQVSGRASEPEPKPRRACLGLESGAGDRRANLHVAVGALEGDPLLEILGQSGTYETETTGDDERQILLGCVLEVESRMSAVELLRYCQGIEAALGRLGEGEVAEKRVKVYLLLYGEQVVREPHLTVPHPKVLLPRNLRAIADMGRNPTVPEVTVADLLANMNPGSIEETREKGWFNQRELEERYGEKFVEELRVEAARLLKPESSSLHEMADERFSAEELAVASALLRVLFRHRKEKGSGGQT